MSCEERENAYELLYDALIEIRVETACEDGNIISGYERIWELSHLMHNVPGRFSRAQNQQGYIEMLNYIEAPVPSGLTDWVNTRVRKTSNEIQNIHALLTQTFIGLHNEGSRVKNKRSLSFQSCFERYHLSWPIQIQRLTTHRSGMKLSNDQTPSESDVGSIV